MSSEWPKCLIIPDNTGSVKNCIRFDMPSMTTIILFIVVAWIIYLAIAYLIYYVVNKNTKVNYWMILLILIISGLIVNILGYFIVKN